MKKSVLQAVVTVSIIAITALSAITVRAEEKPAAEHKAKQITAVVVEADTKASTLSVRKVTNTVKDAKTFHVAADAKITGLDKKAITLGDLKPGEKVTVDYTGHDKVLTASAIVVEAAAPAPAAAPAATPGK